MTNPPKQVWHTIHVDYCGPFPSGEYLFVAVDETSEYPEVYITHSSTAATAIKLLNQKFLQHTGLWKSLHLTMFPLDRASLLTGATAWA